MFKCQNLHGFVNLRKKSPKMVHETYWNSSFFTKHTNFFTNSSFPSSFTPPFPFFCIPSIGLGWLRCLSIFQDTKTVRRCTWIWVYGPIAFMLCEPGKPGKFGRGKTGEPWNKGPPGWWLFRIYRGWKTTQVCGDYFINHFKDPYQTSSILETKMIFFRWVPILGVEIKLGAIYYGNFFRGLPRNIVLLVWVGVITWPLWRTTFFCFLEACWKRVFQVSFGLGHTSINQIGRLSFRHHWRLFPAGKKNTKNPIDPRNAEEKILTSSLVGLVSVIWNLSQPFFCLPVLGLDHEFCPTKPLGWQQIHHRLRSRWPILWRFQRSTPGVLSTFGWEILDLFGCPWWEVRMDLNGEDGWMVVMSLA